MKVISTQVGVLAVGFGLLASVLGMTVITASPAVARTVSLATDSSPLVCTNATVIEA